MSYLGVGPLVRLRGLGSTEPVAELAEVPGGALALPLFVARVRLADDHDAAVATNDLAVVADRLNAWVYLHDGSFAVFVPCPGAWTLLLDRMLAVAVDDAATREVVRAELYDNTVFGDDANVVLTHLA